MKTLCIPLIAGFLVVSAPTAFADQTIVLPTSGGNAALAQRLDNALLAAAKEVTPPASKGAVSLSELALVSGCSEEQPACRKRAIATVKASRLIYASVAADGSITVHLINRKGERGDARVTLGTSMAATDEAVAEAGRRLLRADKPKAVVKPPVDKPPVDKPPVDKLGDSPMGNPTHMSSIEDDTSGKIRPLTWAVLGGGAISLTTGVVFFGLAAQKQGDVDDAPTDTLEDIRRLEDLEGATRFRSGLGFTFVGVGVAAVVAGAVLAVRDRRGPTQLALTPTRGGAMVVFGGNL